MTSRTGGWNQDTLLIHPSHCSPVSRQSPIILLKMANLLAITNRLGWERENRSTWDAWTGWSVRAKQSHILRPWLTYIAYLSVVYTYGIWQKVDVHWWSFVFQSKTYFLCNYDGVLIVYLQTNLFLKPSILLVSLQIQSFPGWWLYWLKFQYTTRGKRKRKPNKTVASYM